MYIYIVCLYFYIYILPKHTCICVDSIYIHGVQEDMPTLTTSLRPHTLVA